MSGPDALLDLIEIDIIKGGKPPRYPGCRDISQVASLGGWVELSNF
jgi:hypothetical protein